MDDTLWLTDPRRAERRAWMLILRLDVEDQMRVFGVTLHQAAQTVRAVYMTPQVGE